MGANYIMNSTVGIPQRVEFMIALSKERRKPTSVALPEAIIAILLHLRHYCAELRSRPHPFKVVLEFHDRCHFVPQNPRSSTQDSRVVALCVNTDEADGWYTVFLDQGVHRNHRDKLGRLSHVARLPSSNC